MHSDHKERIPSDEVKKIELDILKHIKKVCDENSIRYTLLFGTLIGAVRHHGFIPWDDDIDIGVPMPDYLKLMDILKDDGKYLLKYDMKDKDYTYFHAKLTDRRTIAKEKNKPPKPEIGIWVDIFPISSIPENIDTKTYLDALDQANKNVSLSIGSYWVYDPSALKKIIKFFVKSPKAIYHKLKGEKYWKELRRKLYVIEPYESAKRVGVVPTIYGEKSIYPAELFKDYYSMKFEDDEFSVIAEYDKYLRMCYGDYMQLPPVEKRKTEHFDAYYK